MIRKPIYLTILMLSTVIFLMSSLSASKAVAAPDAALFGQLPQVADAALSPDGKRVAVVRIIQGQYAMQIVNLDGSGRDNDIVELGDRMRPKWVRWANNDRALMAVRMTEEYGGRSSKKPQLGTTNRGGRYRGLAIDTSYLITIDANTMESKILVRPRGFRQFNDTVLNWLDDDPDYILMAFASEGNRQSFPDVRRVNVDTGADEMIIRNRDNVSSWITTTSGEAIAAYGFTGSSGVQATLTVRDPLSGDFVNASEFPGLSLDSIIQTGFPDMTRLIVRDYLDNETLGLHVYDLSQKRFTETLFQNDDYDVGHALFSRDGKTVVGATHLADTPQRELLPEYGQVLREAEGKLVGYNVGFIDQSDDGQTLLLRVTSPYDPGGLYLYSASGDFTPLAKYYPELEPAQMGEVIAVRYTARDGVKIPAYVTLPTRVKDTADIKDLPFVVLPHGGPYARDFKDFDWLAQLMASRGYGVLQMNFRGSTGYGKSFEAAGRNDWTVMLNDVEDGTRYLIEKGYADADRICVAGWSYGGYAALMGAANDPELYQCVISIAALTDIKSAYDRAKGFTFGKGRMQRFFGALLDDSDLRKANSPTDRAKDITAPVLLAHGTLDTVVDYDQFVAMRRALKSGDSKVRELSYENDDHYMSIEAHRQDLAEEIEKFLKANLGKSKHAAP